MLPTYSNHYAPKPLPPLYKLVKDVYGISPEAKDLLKHWRT